MRSGVKALGRLCSLSPGCHLPPGAPAAVGMLRLPRYAGPRVSPSVPLALGARPGSRSPAATERRKGEGRGSGRPGASQRREGGEARLRVSAGGT